jgi:hypothetical protein
MSEKSTSTSPSAVQVKHQRKTIGIEEKLDVISRPEKRERIVDIFRNVQLAHSSVRTIRDNADGIKESAKCLDNIKCQQSEAGSVFVARLPQSYRNNPYQNYGCESLTFLLH